jgi:hypothetical protein
MEGSLTLQNGGDPARNGQKQAPSLNAVINGDNHGSLNQAITLNVSTAAGSSDGGNSGANADGGIRVSTAVGSSDGGNSGAKADGQGSKTEEDEAEDGAAVPKPRKGYGNLPLIGINVIPVHDKDVDVKYAKANYKQLFVFDRTKKEIWDDGAAPIQETYLQGVEDVKALRLEAQAAAKVIARNHVFDKFNELQLRADGKNVNEMHLVKDFIRSAGMKEAFKHNPLLPFGLIFVLFHKDFSSKNLDMWFRPQIRQWARKHSKTPFDFEFTKKISENGNTKTVTNSFVLLTKNAAAKIFTEIQNYQDEMFGMHLGRSKKGYTDGKAEEKGYYPPIEINLGVLNPAGLQTYLRVKMDRYPQLGSKPTLADLYDRDRFSAQQSALHAFHLACCCSQEGNSIKTAMKLAEECIRKIYEVGGGVCSIVPPPKKIDEMAVASAAAQIKEAVYIGANNSHQIARGVNGWNLDGLGMGPLGGWKGFPASMQQQVSNLNEYSASMQQQVPSFYGYPASMQQQVPPLPPMHQVSNLNGYSASMQQQVPSQYEYPASMQQQVQPNPPLPDFNPNFPCLDPQNHSMANQHDEDWANGGGENNECQDYLTDDIVRCFTPISFQKNDCPHWHSCLLFLSTRMVL